MPEYCTLLLYCPKSNVQYSTVLVQNICFLFHSQCAKVYPIKSLSDPALVQYSHNATYSSVQCAQCSYKHRKCACHLYSPRPTTNVSCTHLLNGNTSILIHVSMCTKSIYSDSAASQLLHYNWTTNSILKRFETESFQECLF